MATAEEKLALIKEQNRERGRRYRERRMAEDPEAFRATLRANYYRRQERLLADPELLERERAIRREKFRKHYAKKKAAEAAPVEPEEVRDAETCVDEKCGVCMDNALDAAMVPCGHRFCRPCAERCVAVSGECPTCRTAVDSVLRLF